MRKEAVKCSKKAAAEKPIVFFEFASVSTVAHKKYEKMSVQAIEKNV